MLRGPGKGEQKRHPAGEQPARRAGGEPQGRDKRPVSEAVTRQRREDSRRGDDSERAHDSQAEQRGQRRIEHAVGEHVVPRVPVVVPEHEPVVREQVGSKVAADRSWLGGDQIR